MPDEVTKPVTRKQAVKVESALSGLKSVTVRTKGAHPDAVFFDPLQRANIGSTFVTVKRTEFVAAKLNGGELQEQ